MGINLMLFPFVICKIDHSIKLVIKQTEEKKIKEEVKDEYYFPLYFSSFFMTKR